LVHFLLIIVQTGIVRYCLPHRPEFDNVRLQVIEKIGEGRRAWGCVQSISRRRWDWWIPPGICGYLAGWYSRNRRNSSP
jgi:hypothetical protein